MWESTVALQVIGISVCGALIVELLSWLVVYRTSSYKRLKTELESVAKKIELAQSAGDKDGVKKKKKLEETLMKLSREFQFAVRWKTGAITAVMLFLMYRFVSTQYSGLVAARLPFVAPSFMRRVTHNSLPGEDYSEASALFIYVLCQMSLRTNITKLFNFGPSRALNKLTSFQTFVEKYKAVN